MGIVSSIGNNAQEVVASLREARSGIVKADDYERLGFRSQVHGSLKIDLDAIVDRRARRFHGRWRGLCVGRDGAGDARFRAWNERHQSIRARD